jgi:Na+/proline symporter
LYYIAVYILLLLFLILFQKKKSPIFTVKKKKNWFLPSLSLFLLYGSLEQGQLITNILYKDGIWGLWFLWIGTISFFVIPIVFAPIWRKLNLKTDNDFILLRFPGKDGLILYHFRAIFLSVLVIPILVSFHAIAFSRIIEVYFNVTDLNSKFIVCFIILCVVIKNRFELKLKTDALNALIYLIVFLIVIIYLFRNHDFSLSIAQQLVHIGPDHASLFPPKGNKIEWGNFWIVLFIQWWSTSMMDGSGPEMIRYTALKNNKEILKTAIISASLHLLITFILLAISLLLVVKIKNNSGEIQFVVLLFESVPNVLKGICMVGFLALFISGVESLLSWGGGLLHYEKINYNANLREEVNTKRAYLFMFIISMIGCLCTLLFENLHQIILFIFSISAGVAPVFILRWIWRKINGWSQLSAMFSSAFYTLIFTYFFQNHQQVLGLSFASARLTFVTLLTSLTWVIITIISSEQISKQAFEQIKLTSLKPFLAALILGAVFLSLLASSVYFLVQF